MNAVASAPLLSLRGLSKDFAGNPAVQDLNLDVYGGEIVALLGQNGAGKSTVIKMMAGIHAPSAGRMTLRGQPLTPGKAGLAFIHQDLGLVEWMTVAENLALNRPYPRRGLLVDWPEVRRRAAAALERVGGGIDPDARIKRLPRAERALVAIARALAVKAEVLVLDEPTSSLPDEDVKRLFEVLRGLRSQGVGMIYVSHRLDEIFAISDRSVVMRDGRQVWAGRTADTTPAELVQAIVGQAVGNLYPRGEQPQAGAAQLEVKNLLLTDGQRASFAVQPGEVLALTGLKGAGQGQVARALFGLGGVLGGEVRVGGQLVRHATPAEAMSAGIGFVSANRREESLALGLNIRENFFMNPAVRGVGPLQRLDAGTEAGAAQAWVTRYDVRPADPEVPVETLSGGNQQKIVMGRWLEFQGRVLILEEPTLGVDVGSKAAIYGLLTGALSRGLGVLLVSTDFEEVVGISHRALVFDKGEIVAELSGAGLTVQQLTLHAAGGVLPGQAVSQAMATQTGEAQHG